MPKLGCITPSRFKDVMTKGKKKGELFGQTALTYADELAMNITTGIEKPEVTAKSLDHGNEMEPFAIQAYERENFVKVETVDAHIHHPNYDYVCGIMDGLVHTDGVIEIKCPHNPLNHWKNIMYGEQYEKLYKWQVQGYPWITRRQWTDFASFSADERWGNNMLYVHRIERNPELIEQLEERIPLFWEIVQNMVLDYSKK